MRFQKIQADFLLKEQRLFLVRQKSPSSNNAGGFQGGNPGQNNGGNGGNDDNVTDADFEEVK